MKIFKKIVKASFNKLGFDIVKISDNNYPFNGNQNQDFPPDFFPKEIDIIKEVIPYTMTSKERLYSLIKAVNYVSKNNIEGDIVECGVWKGGSMMAIAKALKNLNDETRDLYLFDTFSGMTEPSDKDKDFKGEKASYLLNNARKDDSYSVWCLASIEIVKEAMQKTGYEKQKIHFIQGMVEETIPKNAPTSISLLRLDTDWYESTKHELIHLYPRLSVGGIIIIDDYGYWQGSRLATDEYIEQNNVKILLHRIDNTGRIAVKLEE